MAQPQGNFTVKMSIVKRIFKPKRKNFELKQKINSKK
jgi:hypothetical protein